MRWAYVCVVLCGGVVSNAQAEERVNLPKYDPDTTCAIYYRSPDLWMEETLKVHYINQCIREEQAGYDHLKTIWFSASNEAEKNCVVTNGTRPAMYLRYRYLDSCIDARYRQEQRHEQSIEHFRP